jgi:trans-aconitate methyltransferase
LGLASRWYERRKYEITIASLPRERYHRCFEPGCSIGELTKLLATRCDQVLAVDCSVEAIAQARDALRCVANVQVELAMLPAPAPQDDFDLIVLSEILYYFNKADLQVVLDQLISRLAPDGDLVAVHLRSRDQFRGYDGFNVHAALGERTELTRLISHEDEEFILDVLRRHSSGPATTEFDEE